jgi:hypothetical protein
VAGRGGRIVNGDLDVSALPAAAAAGGVAIAAVVGMLVAHVFALSVTVVMAAGLLLGRPVGFRTALTAAVRRVPALLVFVVLVMAGVLVTAGAGFGMAIRTKNLWVGAADPHAQRRPARIRSIGRAGTGAHHQEYTQVSPSIPTPVAQSGS